MAVCIFHADHVLPGDVPPIGDGAVVVGDDGDVLDVGPASDILAQHHASASATGGVDVVRVRGILLPGLVNAHTHLELSAMRGKVGGGRGFVGWVDSLIAQRVEMAPEDDGGRGERQREDGM